MSQFNQFSFNESSFNELDSTGGGMTHYISATINTGSTLNVYPSGIRISAEILPTFSKSVVNGNIVATYSISGTIDCSSSVEASVISEKSLVATIDTSSEILCLFNLLVSTINCTSTILGNIHTIYSNPDTEIDTSSTVSGTLFRTIPVSATIDTSSSINGILGHIIELSGSIDTSSSISGDMYDFKRLQSDYFGGETTIYGNLSDLRLLISEIDTSSTIYGKVNLTTNLGGAVIETNSTLPYNFGQIEIITGSSIDARINVPVQLIKKRREATYIFEVDNSNNNSTIIDKHYNIFRFLNSLSDINSTLDYVRRESTRDLQSQRIGSETHRSWSSNEDLKNISTGDRGLVQKNATGIFTEKDGFFALYKGPNYVNGQIEME